MRVKCEQSSASIQRWEETEERPWSKYCGQCVWVRGSVVVSRARYDHETDILDGSDHISN